MGPICSAAMARRPLVKLSDLTGCGRRFHRRILPSPCQTRKIVLGPLYFSSHRSFTPVVDSVSGDANTLETWFKSIFAPPLCFSKVVGHLVTMGLPN
ncbi:hypothetical protein L2E82_48099 [Cichorium intybus]|uniref:Uncharacterized protein n=1 Tax=Cichorium intybus TaxID=13427 RepID=A0ACB8YXK5_CICIN|nr:hypothetical protein L2E82_48099 [Cichorium intybus]